jgi:hypothetical protein
VRSVKTPCRNIKIANTLMKVTTLSEMDI